MKQKCAKAALKLIKDNMVVGLGGGSTIGHLIQFIAQENLSIQVVTPSQTTALSCKQAGLQVIPTWLVDHIDIAFDGCDEIDYQCRALKSGGGIMTNEKIIGSIADEYVLLVDSSKVSKSLEFKVPVVIEVIQEALSYVMSQVQKMGGTISFRSAPNKDGIMMSDHGNPLLEAVFCKDCDIEKLNQDLLMMSGVVDTSLVVGIVSSALVIHEDKIYQMKKDGVFTDWMDA